MTKDEARQVVKILKTADGGCSFCVTELLARFYKKFPEWKADSKGNPVKVKE
jgi:hypothetical protein